MYLYHAEGSIWHSIPGQPWNPDHNNPNVDTERHLCGIEQFDPDISHCVKNNHINGGDPTLSVENTHVYSLAQATALGMPWLAGMTNVGTFLMAQYDGYHHWRSFGGCRWFQAKIIQFAQNLYMLTPAQMTAGVLAPFYQSKVDWFRCMWDRCCLPDTGAAIPPDDDLIYQGKKIEIKKGTTVDPRRGAGLEQLDNYLNEHDM